MGYCVAPCKTQIVGSYKDLAVFDYNAANGAFAEFYGLFRFFDGFQHEAFLVGGRLEIRI